MKPQALILAASIATNALLLAFLLLGRDSTAKALPFLSNAVQKSASTASSSQNINSAEPSNTALAQAIASRDPATLRDQLRALGLPEDAIGSMVRALLRQSYLDRYHALVAKHKSDKSDLLRGSSYTTSFTPAERSELRDLQRDINKQIVSLLGPNSIDADLNTLRYGYLPPEKAAQLSLLNQDYREMINDLKQESARFHVASDDDKLALLDQERQKDIDALLTPSEAAEYDLRNSKVASSLRYRLASTTVTDDEFRSLYATLTQAEIAQAKLADNGTPTDEQQAAARQARREIRTQTDEAIKALLGDERYAEYRRSMDPDYHNLQTAATRFNLAPKTIEQVLSLRTSVATESNRIANDSALDPEQKKNALSSLADQTRSQVKTTLGLEIGTTYLATSMRWLDRMAGGYAVSFPATGYINTYKAVAPPAPPANP